MNGFKQLIPTEKKLYQVEHLFYMLNQNPHIYHVNYGSILCMFPLQYSR